MYPRENIQSCHTEHCSRHLEHNTDTGCESGCRLSSITQIIKQSKWQVVLLGTLTACFHGCYWRVLSCQRERVFWLPSARHWERSSSAEWPLPSESLGGRGKKSRNGEKEEIREGNSSLNERGKCEGQESKWQINNCEMAAVSASELWLCCLFTRRETGRLKWVSTYWDSGFW